jgi:cytochrome c-type biogenesis protein CcmH/NrfF
MRKEVATLVDAGKTHDEIIQAMVTKYGSEEMLGAPMDKGFRRLAWLLPWTVGASAAAAVGLVAVRWSKNRRDEEPETTAAVTDPELNERLDDELRNLD